jgi:hypothetical protein
MMEGGVRGEETTTAHLIHLDPGVDRGKAALSSAWHILHMQNTHWTTSTISQTFLNDLCWGNLFATLTKCPDRDRALTAGNDFSCRTLIVDRTDNLSLGSGFKVTLKLLVVRLYMMHRC